MQAIKVENLSKTFQVRRKEKGMRGSIKAILRPRTEEIRAVDGVSFAVEEGEILAFIGPNGAGKSTTIKMLTGILYPDGGRVEVLGIDPVKARKRLAYQIGTVFGQKEQLWTHLTPYDNFRFFGAIYDMTDRETEERIGELAELFALGAFINTPVRSLSLGQRIRCEIAASLIHRPKVLFLDEPTIGLDPVVKENIRSLIKKMNEELRMTIFLTSHDIGDIEKLCKRIIIVNAGQIVLDDSMEQLKYHYLQRKVKEVKGHEEVKGNEGAKGNKEAKGNEEVKGYDEVKGYEEAKGNEGAKGNEEAKGHEATRMHEETAIPLREDGDFPGISLEEIIMEIYKSEGRSAAL